MFDDDRVDLLGAGAFLVRLLADLEKDPKSRVAGFVVLDGANERLLEIARRNPDPAPTPR